MMLWYSCMIDVGLQISKNQKQKDKMMCLFVLKLQCFTEKTSQNHASHYIVYTYSKTNQGNKDRERKQK